jgi:hypothetical protein
MIQTARALQWAWLTLVLVTALSFTLAESAEISGDFVIVVIIAAAALKGRVIMVWFMGLRSFPLAWRVLFGLWLLINAGMIIGFHFVGQG